MEKEGLGNLFNSKDTGLSATLLFCKGLNRINYFYITLKGGGIFI